MAVEGSGPLSPADYDRWTNGPEETAATVEFLLRDPRPATALELGVGTGRVAVPLAQAGVDVVGLDLSDDMLATLDARANGLPITCVRADFSSFDLDRAFDLAFVTLSTIFALTTQERQVSCFLHVARALGPGGRFVLETAVPDPHTWSRDYVVRTAAVLDDGIMIEASRADVVTQVMHGRRIYIDDDGPIRTVPFRNRWASVAELDLMALHAGFELAGRWSDWSGGAFDPRSKRQICVYRLVRPPRREGGS